MATWKYFSFYAITLQLNEPGTLWCSATELPVHYYNVNCREGDVQESDAQAPCFFETMIKGSSAAPDSSNYGSANYTTTFRADVHEAFRSVDIEVNRIWSKDLLLSKALSTLF